MSKRVYFAPCGIGLGHAGRCVEVARRFPPECEILFSTYSDAVEFVRAEGFKVLASPGFEYWTWPDGTVDPWRSLKWGAVKSLFTFRKQTEAEMRNLQKFKPDLVVSDMRLSSLVAAAMLGIPSLTILNQLFIQAPGFIHHNRIDVFARAFSLGLVSPLWRLSREILVPDFPPPQTICALNMQSPPSMRRKLTYTGPILPVKPDALLPAEALKKKLGFNSDPLIYVALSGPRFERHWLAEKLLKHLHDFPPSYQFAFSRAQRNGEAAPRRIGPVTVFDWLNERFEMLKAADVVVGRGSHATLTQCLAYGKPMLLIPTPEQTEQISNAKSAVRIGVAKMLDQRNISKERLIENLQPLLDDELYRRKALEMAESASKTDAVGIINERIRAHLAQ
ncbi:MAG: glycosyltransferase [Candidatus Bathyarchaeia archaeon]